MDMMDFDVYEELNLEEQGYGILEDPDIDVNEDQDVNVDILINEMSRKLGIENIDYIEDQLGTSLVDYIEDDDPYEITSSMFENGDTEDTELVKFSIMDMDEMCQFLHLFKLMLKNVDSCDQVEEFISFGDTYSIKVEYSKNQYYTIDLDLDPENCDISLKVTTENGQSVEDVEGLKEIGELLTA